MHRVTESLPAKWLLPIALIATSLGCAGLSRNPADSPAVPLANHASPAATGVGACHRAITAPSPGTGPTLDPRHIGLLVWNIHKGAHPQALADLQRLAAGKELVLIQEARLEQEPVRVLREARFWSFAPGYRTGSTSTGVMTLSAAEPLAHCHLADREPWLRSPKAIGITRFKLAASEQTLAVVNVHAVNFTLGLVDFRRQIDKIETTLKAHEGPVILAGDFNTWRKARLAVLLQAAHRLRLQEISFDEDARFAPFGSAVDRVFVRDLRVIDASIQAVDSSDHNPLSVTLRM